MTPPKDALLLIDGHAVLYRAFHAIPPLQTKDGQQTNAIYGFITTLLKAIEEVKPKYCAVAFDLSGKTFRHDAFEGYKASRKETPDGLKSQIPYAYKVAEALNIPIFTKETYEADDVIGTLAKQANAQGIPVVIVTGDKDSFQLVNDVTFVYTMKRAITDTMLYDAVGVKERMGVHPNQVVDYKALAGDASDEIPGISGIGDKTAINLLEFAGSLDALYSLLKNDKDIPVTPRIRQKLIDGEKIAYQSRDLATIHRDVPITLELMACDIADYDPQKVSDLFNALEFYSLIKRLPKAHELEVAATQSVRDWTYKTLVTKGEIAAAAIELRKAEVLTVDTETDGIDGPIIGISLASQEDLGYYVPLIAEHGATLSKEEIGELLKPLLEDTDVAKVGHNVKYDMCALEQVGIDLKPIAFDTMVAAYILHAHLRTFDFDTVCQREFGYTPISFADVAGSKKKDATLVTAPAEKVAEYAAEDAILTHRLYNHYAAQLHKEKHLKVVAETIDFPLIPVLKAMEQHGVCLDIDQLKKLEAKLEKEIGTIRTTIEGYASGPININSPAQLQKLLFEDLKLDKTGMKATQSGTSTAASELEKLQGMHPVIDDIMRYRELTKLQSTYVKTLPELVDQHGRLHTSFSITTAATGRLSSSDPNLQNIPIRSELGNEIRKAFVAPKGYDLISLDYSQMELRIIAHLSQDPALLQVYRDGRDIHDEVSKQLGVDRRAAKAINFGIIYGLSAFGLAQGLKIEQKVAKQYIDAYFATYKGVADYLTKTKQEIRDKGYVETIFGRRREIPEIKASNAMVRAAAERMAINAPAQGTEADIIKLAMIQVHDWLEHTYANVKERPYLTLQVHDSLLLESPESETERVAAKVKELMEHAYELDIPLTVDCSIGKNWGELEKI